MSKKKFINNFNINKRDCYPKVNSKGAYRKFSKYKYSLNDYNDVLCLLKGSRKLAKILFPALYGMNEEILFDKLKIIVLAQHNNLNAVLIESYKNDDEIILFDNKEINIFRAYLFNILFDDISHKKTKKRLYIKHQANINDRHAILCLMGYLFGYSKKDIRGYLLREILLSYLKSGQFFTKNEKKYVLKNYDNLYNLSKKKNYIDKILINIIKIGEKGMINEIHDHLFNSKYIMNDYIKFKNDVMKGEHLLKNHNIIELIDTSIKNKKLRNNLKKKIKLFIKEINRN